MRSRPSRLAGVILALIAAAWAFVLLPPQQHAFSGAYAMPAWLFALNRMSPYDTVREWLVANGQSDFYLVFGAAASASFLLIWLATGPAFAALGRSGRVLGWLVLAGAPVTLLSYLNHPSDAPLRMLWGAEAFVLIAIGLWALVVAFAAPRGAGIPRWERVLLAATLPLLVLATLALSYYPHGTLVGLGLEAAALAAWGARPAPVPETPEAAAPTIDRQPVQTREGAGRSARPAPSGPAGSPGLIGPRPSRAARARR